MREAVLLANCGGKKCAWNRPSLDFTCLLHPQTTSSPSKSLKMATLNTTFSHSCQRKFPLSISSKELSCFRGSEHKLYGRHLRLFGWDTVLWLFLLSETFFFFHFSHKLDNFSFGAELPKSISNTHLISPGVIRSRSHP